MEKELFEENFTSLLNRNFKTHVLYLEYNYKSFTS